LTTASLVAFVCAWRIPLWTSAAISTAVSNSASPAAIGLGRDASP